MSVLPHSSVMKVLRDYAYIRSDTDRHGNLRVYYRRYGRSVRLSAEPGSKLFELQYQAAEAGEPIPAALPGEPSPAPKPNVATKAAPGSLKWLVDRYCAEAAVYKRLADSTKRTRKRQLDRWCLETDDAGRQAGTKMVKNLLPRHLHRRMDRLCDTPEAANDWLKAARKMFRWAVKQEILQANPAMGVEFIETSTEGHHSWTPDEVAQYEAHHPLGTTPRLAMALLVYTAQRRSDVVILGRQHLCRIDLDDGSSLPGIRFTQVKGRNQKMKALVLPIIAPLQEALEAGPLGDLAFLKTQYGKPFSAAGFGNAMRKWCDAAGLPHCSAHGLRKATAALIAESSASAYEVQAILGDSLKQSEQYTRAARQKVLAVRAMGRVAQRQSQIKIVPPSEGVRKSGTISGSKSLK